MIKKILKNEVQEPRNVYVKMMVPVERISDGPTVQDATPIITELNQLMSKIFPCWCSSARSRQSTDHFCSSLACMYLMES